MASLFPEASREDGGDPPGTPAHRATGGPGPGGPKRLLVPADLPDQFTRSLYKVAPYRGCEHGCAYCDGRSERYYVEGDFERDIQEKRDVPARMEADLPKLRERGLVAFGSGTTDPYQGREAKLELTGACARLLASGPVPPAGTMPALVMTKSALALRDLPAWSAVAKRAGFVLMVSLTSLDEELRSLMEPRASPFADRLRMIRDFKAAGCAVGVLAMPFLPGLSDGEDSIRGVYEAASEAGADFILGGGLTLRPGRQKDHYLDVLAAARPELLGPTRDLYREERPSGAPTAAASRALFARVASIQRDCGVPPFLPHRLYAAMVPPHDALRLLLRDMADLYGERGVDVRGLRRSADAYDRWLVSRRRTFRRKRTLPAGWLDDALPEAARRGELRSILGNAKLARFCESVVLDGARLDYVTLKVG